jgi:hypothetical protein
MGHAFDVVGTSTILAAVSWCLDDPDARTA